ncbi:zinc finger protein 618 isoform X5 [Ctenopharyngodon idella]|uniref:zinc finger protein 618 isoform X5 n=1 Tax=Ctenopharyngodon idella TaxID=7959 RepID=UPI00222F1EEF|nr:zinc finger protein 618 isoform X5 [Ctenopharyngodon idella]
MSCQEVPNPSQEPKDTAVVPTEAGATQAVPTTSPKLPPVTVKTEVASTAESVASNGKASDGNIPAEICVVLGSSRNSQTQGSYVCGVCGKKYKYYNCFQTHVRAHTEAEGTASGEGASLGINSSFRYTCDVCGKKYKYYSCFQEHRDLHAVDDPYDHVIPVEDLKEETESYQKMGPNLDPIDKHS